MTTSTWSNTIKVKPRTDMATGFIPIFLLKLLFSYSDLNNKMKWNNLYILYQNIDIFWLNKVNIHNAWYFNTYEIRYLGP